MPAMRVPLLFPIALLLLAVSSPLAAHDLWLDLQKEPASRTSIVVRAVLGAKFPKIDEVKKVEGYREARVIMDGAPGGPLADFKVEPTLVGRVTTDQPFAVSVLGPMREIDLKIDEAREYLGEEVGLSPEEIVSILEGGSPTVHETYSRTLKAIDLRWGDARLPSASSFSLPLEINLTKAESKSGGWELTYQILKDGKPIPGAHARIMAPSAKTQLPRTGQDGSAKVSVPRGGPVLIAYIELTSSGKGRYETRWTNLAIFLN